MEALPLPLFSVISQQRGTFLICHIGKYFPYHVGRLFLVHRTILDLCANFDFHYSYLDIIFMLSFLPLLMCSLNKNKHELYLLFSSSLLEGLVYSWHRDNAKEDFVKKASMRLDWQGRGTWVCIKRHIRKERHQDSMCLIRKITYLWESLVEH